jgi:hypothetical protein
MGMSMGMGGKGGKKGRTRLLGINKKKGFTAV